MPENESVTLAFPPLLDILEYCDREQLDELIISTPGLAGLAALAVGKMLDLRMVGIYHTDLPQYIQYYTQDETMEATAWRYLRWFYEQMMSSMCRLASTSNNWWPRVLIRRNCGSFRTAPMPRYFIRVIVICNGGNGSV